MVIFPKLSVSCQALKERINPQYVLTYNIRKGWTNLPTLIHMLSQGSNDYQMQLVSGFIGLEKEYIGIPPKSRMFPVNFNISVIEICNDTLNESGTRPRNFARLQGFGGSAAISPEPHNISEPSGECANGKNQQWFLRQYSISFPKIVLESFKSHAAHSRPFFLLFSCALIYGIVGYVNSWVMNPWEHPYTVRRIWLSTSELWNHSYHK